MLKLGNENIKALYLGETEITKAYLGEELVFNSIPVYTVTVIVDPADFGTVTGAGKYKEGETCTLKATVSDTNKFVSWKDGETIVSTSDTYSFTVTGDFTLTATFKASRLPAGYTELEYIESSGTQYIDSKLLPSAVGKVQMGIVEITGTAASQHFFGSTSSFYKTKTYGEFYMYASNLTTIRAAMNAVTGTYVYYTTVATGIAKTNITLELNYTEGSATVNGSTVSGMSKGTNVYQPNIYIFTCSYKTTTNSAEIPTSNNPASAKLGYCKMYDRSGVLSRDFVPCKNPSNAVGLYDLVSKTFFANIGTGTFIAGPEI